MDIVSVNGEKVNTQAIGRLTDGTLPACHSEPIALHNEQVAELDNGDGLGLLYVSYRAVDNTGGNKKREYSEANKKKAPTNVVTAYDGASLLEFRPERASVAQASKRGRVARGTIGEFSRGSARRFQQEFNKVQRVELVRGLLVTLTYPDDYERWTVAETKKHLRAFFKRLQRVYPNVAVMWKLEPQKRGAPHYHLVGLGVRKIDKHWLSRAWYEVVGSGDIKHLHSGTQRKNIKDYNGVCAYLSSYLAKSKNKLTDGSPGRFWGVMGPIERYYGDKVVFDMPGEAAVDMYRVLDKRRLALARRPVGKGYTDRWRRWQIIKARKRRAGYKQSRWYICDVGQLLRAFIEGVRNGQENNGRE
jgi:hypothetical protein